MSDSVADDELAAFVDRILRMKSEEDAIKADIKEIYAEAKGRGYDKTRLGETVATVRKLEKDEAGEAEKESIRDLYLTAYFRAKNKPHTHAYARAALVTTKSASVPAGFEAEAGEEVTTQENTQTQPMAPSAATDLTADPAPSVDSRQVNEQPETATRGVDDLGSVQDALEMSSDGQPAEGLSNSDSRTPGEETAGVTGGESAATIAFIPRKQLRPNCLNRERCGASGPKECWVCQKAAAEKTGAA